MCVCVSYLSLREQHPPFSALRERKLHRLRVADAARTEAAHVGHVTHRATRRAAHQSRNWQWMAEKKGFIKYLILDYSIFADQYVVLQKDFKSTVLQAVIPIN